MMSFTCPLEEFRTQLQAAPRRIFSRSEEYQVAQSYLSARGVDVKCSQAKQALREFARTLQQRRADRRRALSKHYGNCLRETAHEVLQLRLASAKTPFAKRLIKAEINRRKVPSWIHSWATAPQSPPTEARRVFQGSDGNATKRFLKKLEAITPYGYLAAELFRCQKASTCAKAYRGKPRRGGRSFREFAYENKQYALGGVIEILNGTALSITWGWQSDDSNPRNPWVLYVDLPNGQVSFHSPVRDEGPDYLGEWDGSFSSESRIISFCDSLLDSPASDSVPG
ncbi:hypothetical protein NA78x_003494 [Anatilimnocola sp. NA78]|uniref:hypothetical protein n=1 Tax=Anatilimnocola sp. NA78 TaxID=3415683 RepID=UPI003CE51862